MDGGHSGRGSGENRDEAVLGTQGRGNGDDNQDSSRDVSHSRSALGTESPWVAVGVKRTMRELTGSPMITTALA